jgi:hypothetical protein
MRMGYFGAREVEREGDLVQEAAAAVACVRTAVVDRRRVGWVHPSARPKDAHDERAGVGTVALMVGPPPLGGRQNDSNPRR